MHEIFYMTSSFRNLLFDVCKSLIALLSDIYSFFREILSSMEPTISLYLFSDTDAAMASFQVLVKT